MSKHVYYSPHGGTIYSVHPQGRDEEFEWHLRERGQPFRILLVPDDHPEHAALHPETHRVIEGDVRSSALGGAPVSATVTRAQYDELLVRLAQLEARDRAAPAVASGAARASAPAPAGGQAVAVRMGMVRAPIPLPAPARRAD